MNVNRKYSIIAVLILIILLCIVRGNDIYNIPRKDINNTKCKRDSNIQESIYKNAKANIGDKSWAKDVSRRAKKNTDVYFEKGDWKCNLFVYEIILASGLDIGTPYGCDGSKKPPVTGDWYNYKHELIKKNAKYIGEGSEGMNKAIPGDIITDGIHMGIYAGNGEIINAGKYDVHITDSKKNGQWGYEGYGYSDMNDNPIPLRIFRIDDNQLVSTNNIVSISSDVNIENDHNNECNPCHCNIMDNYYLESKESENNGSNIKYPWLWIGIGIFVNYHIYLLL